MQAEIHAEYAQLLFVDDDAADEDLEEHWTDAAVDLRLAPFPGGFMVGTLGDGPVSVDLETVVGPPETDGAAWDHVVRGGVELPSGKLVAAGPSFADAVGVRLAPGRYGVEVRFLDFAEPHPRCSVRLWEAAEAPRAALVATSGTCADGHDAALRRHLRGVWPDRPIEGFVYTGGPIQESVPTFRALRFAPPDEGDGWVYVSSGASLAEGDDGARVEFAVRAEREDALHVELLAALTHFHHDPALRALAAGRMIDLGRRWLEDSPADHLALARSWPGHDPLPPATTPAGRVDFLWARLVDAREAATLGG